MGDCLLVTSPLRALKKEFSGFRITVLVEARYAECFAGNSDVLEIMTSHSGKLGTAWNLRGERFDAIVNLHGGPTSLLFARAARGPCYGIDDYTYSFLYSGLIPRGSTGGHTTQTTLEWFRWLGVRTTQAPPLYYADDSEAQAWARGKTGPEPYVVIHPAAVWQTKRWATDRFREIGRELGRRGWRVVVTAGPGEEDIARAAATDLTRSLLLLGLSIPQLAELIRGADIYIGNDSGPMHLAAAVGTPTVAAWGSSSSKRWHPWGVPYRVVENPIECNPCAGYRCLVAETPVCIESVTVSQVLAACLSLVREPGGLADITSGHGNGNRS